MNWLSELTVIAGDEEVARVALERNGYEISQDTDDPSVWLIRHEKYDQLDSASAVHEDTKSLVSRLTQMSELEGIKLEAAAGSVRRMNSDGSTNKHHFVSLSACIKLESRATATVTFNPRISEEERRQRQAEAAAREAERKRAVTISRVSAAIKDPTVIQVARLVRASSLTMTEAGHIVDIVQDALNGDMTSLTTKAELSRFQRSINHPAVMGLGARHAVSNVQPPVDPMTEDDARSYSKTIGEKWLKQHESDT